MAVKIRLIGEDLPPELGESRPVFFTINGLSIKATNIPKWDAPKSRKWLDRRHWLIVGWEVYDEGLSIKRDLRPTRNILPGDHLEFNDLTLTFSD